MMLRTQVFTILLLGLISSGTANRRFQNSHEHEEDSDIDLDVEDIHLDGNPHVFAKTCFPVTMEVCLPSASSNHTGNTNWIVPPPTTASPSTTLAPSSSPPTTATPSTTLAPSAAPIPARTYCLNDRSECVNDRKAPIYAQPYCSNNGYYKACYDWYDMEVGTATMEPCSRLCDEAICPQGSCRQCIGRVGSGAVCYEETENYKEEPQPPECQNDAYQCGSLIRFCHDNGMSKSCIDKISATVNYLVYPCKLECPPHCINCRPCNRDVYYKDSICYPPAQ